MGETTQHMLSIGHKPDNGGKSSVMPQYLAATAAGLGAVVAGTILAWTSPVMSQIERSPTNNDTSTSSLLIDKEEGSWVGSFVAIGAFLLAIPIGLLAEKVGRKITILLLVLPFLLNWLLIVFASNVAMLYAARFFAGAGTGGICVTAPMYIGEIAEPKIRGTLGSFFQLFLTVGILFTYALGAGTDWRTLSIISAIIPVIFGIAFLFVPETPQYLLKKNNLRGAEKSLGWLRGPEYDVSNEIEILQKEVEEASQHKASLLDLVRNKANLKALICSLGLMFFQQFSGINAVIFYTTDIFDAAGSTIAPHICTIIIGVVQTVFTVISALLIDKAGRRIMLLQSSVIMGICLTVLGIFFKLKQDKADVESIGWIPLASMVIFIIAFSLGFGPIPWMMMGELFSSECKGVASGLAVMLNWGLVFLVTKVFPTMQEKLGGAWAFWIFAIFLLFGTIFTFFVIPETKGKTSAQIQAELAGRK